MLEVQKFLRSRNSETALAELEEEYGIRAVQGKEFPSLYSLKYNMIDSPMDEKIVLECRGLILDKDDNWSVVARPFDKFFNLGEGRAAEIDWDHATVYEKLDGSLMILYYYKSGWRVASSGTPDASGPCNSSKEFATFKDLFWDTFYNHEKYAVPPSYLEGYTFMFELETPHNRVVVPHSEPKLTLIGIRHKGGQEYSINYWEKLADIPCYRKAKTFSFSNKEEMLEFSKTLDPLKQEGFIVRDWAFNRVKVKTAQYVALAHMRDKFSPRAAIEIVRSGETSEVGTYFPEYKKTLEDTTKKYHYLLGALEVSYNCIKDIESQKEFAQKALLTPLPDCLFSLRKGRVGSVKEYLQNARIENLENTLANL